MLRTHLKELTLGAVVTSLAVGCAAPANNKEAPAQRAVVATQPVTTPSSEPTPIETAEPSPTETSPSTSVETGSTELLNTEYFRKLINEKRVSELTNEFPALSKYIDPSFVSAAAAEQGVTAANIQKYRSALDKAYKNPDIYRALGDIQGWMTADILSVPGNKADIATDITVASDNFLDTIAGQIGDKLPGVTTDLLEITSLSREYVDGSRALIDQGATRFARTTSGDLIAAQDYTTEDGSNVTLLVTLSDYNDESKRIGMYALVQIDNSVNDIPGPGKPTMAVLYFSKAIQ